MTGLGYTRAVNAAFFVIIPKEYPEILKAPKVLILFFNNMVMKRNRTEFNQGILIQVSG